jgi:NADH:ubiquinone oxidoreductase subunit 5 (subunit L)/multisubunit Na+/H+ antiporter MnhA subunit
MTELVDLMPFPALLLILAAFLPLVGCILLLFLGRRLGAPLVGYVGTFFAALGFVCSGWGLMRWVAGGNYRGLPYRQAVAAIVMGWSAAPGGSGRGYPGYMDGGIYIDSLTVLMFVTVTLGLLLLHIFATRSMRREPRLPRFFTLTALAGFSVLGLMLSASLLHAVLFLELASVCGSLLVGFRTDRESMTRAAMRMFVVNRVGDVSLFLGLGLFFAFVGKLNWPDLWLLAGDAAQGFSVALPDGSTMPTAVATIAGAALFFGAAARCAQFPMHVWATDAAEGAASSAGLVFTLTQAIGGAFLIARIFPILTPSARLLIAIVGATTLCTASLIALAQSGIKSVLTWLSAAQMGTIVLAIGVRSWSGATFHLVAYCFFQLLLFMTAGAVIRAARGETEMSRLGGLVRKMPATAVISAIAVLSACGTGAVGIGLSGYYSRALVLRHAAAFSSLATDAGRSRAYWALFALPVMASAINAFAMTRWWMLIFGGRPRDRRLYNHAREAPTLIWPMAVLAIMTALAGGWLGVDDILNSSVVEGREAARRVAETSYPSRQTAAKAIYSAAWPSDDSSDDLQRDGASDVAAVSSSATAGALARGATLSDRWLGFALALGIALAAAVYVPGPRVSERLLRIPPVNWLHAWLRNRMYFDELYDAIFVTLVLGLAGLLAWFDRNVVQALSRMLLRS